MVERDFQIKQYNHTACNGLFISQTQSGCEKNVMRRETFARRHRNAVDGGFGLVLVGGGLNCKAVLGSLALQGT